MWGGEGGGGGGVPDVPVCLFIVVANVCDIRVNCFWEVVVCGGVAVSDCFVFDVSVGIDLVCCYFLHCCMSWSFCALAGNESISCSVQFIKSGYSLPV